MSTSDHKTPEQWLTEFHKAFGQEHADINDTTNGIVNAIDLRVTLIGEEFDEVLEELWNARNGEGDLRKIAKELADLVVVVVGTAEILGIPFDRTFDAVMANNMSKVGPDGLVIRREDGKVLKPATYRPTDLSFIPA